MPTDSKTANAGAHDVPRTDDDRDDDPDGDGDSKGLNDDQYEAAEMTIDMIEHSFDVEVVRLVRLGNMIVVHGYDCAHGDAHAPSGTPNDDGVRIFECPQCGTVAEVVTREWTEDDTLESKADRIEELINEYFAPPKSTAQPPVSTATSDPPPDPAV